MWMRRVIFFLLFYLFFFSERAARGGVGGLRCQTFFFFFFPCSADHERDWPPCKVVFFGLATNALNVRNNNNKFVPLFTICITSPKTVYAIYSIYLIATL